ncbi:MAG TPA: extracellular solute-binding protein, partial [Alphaproteobacteria bacterium]|nr:extracellular solute-binding protein [Alphaproteobacteria bacterium]
VMAYRADRLAPPADWDGVAALARAGQVTLPMLPPHSLMCFFTLAVSAGHAVAATREALIAPAAGVEVIERLAAVTAHIEPSNFAMDPIAASEAMARRDALVALMPLGYGYASYARAGFRAHPLTFTDIPLPGHRGSALGGTGIAVSAFSRHQEEAAGFAYFVASAEVQRGLYAEAGGQPGHAAAWDDEAVNAATNGFYRNTRRTLEAAWVRPRHNGYMAFQDAASRRLNAGLIERESPAAIVADLNRLYRESW